MKTEKPKRLINLLNDLLNENNKSEIEKIYSEITKETQKAEFIHDSKSSFRSSLNKMVIRNSTTDFINSRSEASKETLIEIIENLNSVLVIVE